MATTFDYKLLRVKPSLADDADYVGTQAVPADTFQVVRAPNEDTERPIVLEVVCEFLTVASVVDPAGRGSYSLSVIRVVDRPTGLGAAVTDSVTYPLIPGGRSVTIGDVIFDDQTSVRITNCVNPGASTQVRIMYREHPQS